MPWLVTTGPAVLYVTLFAMAFVLLSLALGRRVSIWFGLRDQASTCERGLLALVLGVGVLQFLPFLLGVVGLLTPLGVRIGCAVLLLACSFDAVAVLQRARASLRELSAPPRWLAAWLAALAPGLLVALLLALTPALDADGLGYHLTVPKRWLALGSLAYLPTYPYSNTPMGVEMLFTIGLSWAGDAAAKSVHLLLGGAACVGLFSLGKRLGSETLGALATALYLYGPFGAGSLLGWAYVEGATAAALIASGLAWLVWWQGRHAGYLSAAAMLAGIGVSFKLTAGLFPAALAALTLVLLAREARERGKASIASLLPLLKLAPLIVLPVLPWLVRSALVTGNPFFPMFAQGIPSRDFTAAQSAAFDQYNRYMAWGVGVGANWDLGLRKQLLAGAFGFIALAGLLIYRRLSSFPARATALVLLGCVLVQLAAAGLYKRYWTPLFAIAQVPLLLLFAAPLAASWARPAVIVLTGALSVLTARESLKGVDNDVGGLVKTALGVESQELFLRRHLQLFPLYEQVNREPPQSTGVLLSAYCGGFHIDRSTFCVDIVQNSLRLSSWSEFVSDLKRLGVTHALAPRDWLEPLPPSDAPPRLEVGNTALLIRPQERELVGRVLRQHGRLMSAAGDQGLYAIDLASLD